MRIVVVLGYRPIFWFSDSYNYILDAVTHTPDQVRPNGYPFFLDLLLPLHNDMRSGCSRRPWASSSAWPSMPCCATAACPGGAQRWPPCRCCSTYELHLEQKITADPLFIFLATLAVVILCLSNRPSVLTMAVAGAAHRVRNTGAVGRGAAAHRGHRRHARPAGRLARARPSRWGILPIGLYMVWFHQGTGKYALSESQGSFLYSRVSTFAECSKMNVPALPGLPLRPDQAAIPPGGGGVHLGGQRAEALSEGQHAAVPGPRQRHLAAVRPGDQRPDQQSPSVPSKPSRWLTRGR